MWKAAVFALSTIVYGQSNPAALSDYYERAQSALAAGRYEEARKAYEKLREMEPGLAEIHSNLGLIYFKERKLDEAVAALRRALALKPGLAPSRSLLAISLSELGNYREALPELEKAFRESHSPDAKRICGLHLLRAYDNLQRERDAVEVALQLNGLFPNDPEVLYQTGKVYGNYAYLTMRKLGDVAPDSIWRHQAAAEAFESQGAADQAVAEYRAVLALDPRRPGIHYRIGRTLLGQAGGTNSSDNPAAEEEFERELEIDPTNANAAYELGEMFRKSGQMEKAREYFERGLKYYPDFQQAHLALGGTLIALEKPDLALSHLKKAAVLDPEDDVTFYRLARAYQMLGNEADRRAALAEYERLHKTRRKEDVFQASDVTRQTQ